MVGAAYYEMRGMSLYAPANLHRNSSFIRDLADVAVRFVEADANKHILFVNNRYQ